VYFRELQKAVAYTQEGFTGAAGLDRTYISGVELGERNVSLISICRSADTLNIRPAQLIDFYKPAK